MKVIRFFSLILVAPFITLILGLIYSMIFLCAFFAACWELSAKKTDEVTFHDLELMVKKHLIGW